METLSLLVSQLCWARAGRQRPLPGPPYAATAPGTQEKAEHPHLGREVKRRAQAPALQPREDGWWEVCQQELQKRFTQVAAGPLGERPRNRDVLASTSASRPRHGIQELNSGWGGVFLLQNLGVLDTASWSLWQLIQLLALSGVQKSACPHTREGEESRPYDSPSPMRTSMPEVSFKMNSWLSHSAKGKWCSSNCAFFF